ncbi:MULTISPECIES: phage baseplate assembly protein V [Psychrilyobacter]|uniref:Phage baseplate assembly protein V n=1 Tax=Psychrilyobacter piezotolerans TaxID=2293438 RepID=A0ABX9KJC5_9FUSO|nr:MULTISPECIES: phage baseplate assembly protein V [Psychrilyobacter]MCS5421244.1 phage baseplate assembly protein V [Psychrilyobacter sp. S5]NDI76999.1 phage baseplate assembly protein V [Psychrilyobacter piezotolerans]RDE64616.1 phage baseplate assembly protein V [Psychrilyobacter sp. S5]REI42428.1 phage baseplate assembly protein V [Psychrilyobacter piezotolerans]
MEFRFLRTGKVSSINHKATTARVEFDDAPGIISKPLKVLMDHTNTEKNYSMPSIGENAVCIFLPHAPSVGFILGSYSSEKNLPKDTGKMKYIIFPDGTKIKYNFETHLLEINCVGDIDIKGANNVNISSKNIVMTTDNLTINAKATSIAGASLDINAVTTAKNITAEEVGVTKLSTPKGDVDKHKHKDAESRETTAPV